MRSPAKGRGARFNTPNKFEALHLEPMEVESQDDGDRPVRTIFYKDTSKSVLARNDSPDVPFTYSLNPYRGCEHGCIYCYARPSHEYLGFSAGLDFETKILVKHDAPELLAKELNRKSWKPQWVCLSGNTDCYQPAERSLRLTRRCLEVFLRFRNPLGIITKNYLVTRDLDILKNLSAMNLVDVTISITSLDADLVRLMEPRTTTPAKRFDAVELLLKNGVPVNINISPIIPGLNDEEIPAILKAAAKRGATRASYTLVRLPGAVGTLFFEWVERSLPGKAQKILRRIKETHRGTLDDGRWGLRMSGEGMWSETVNRLFELNCKKFGFEKHHPVLTTEHFRNDRGKQAELFG
ncbi:MAG TPA: PA0069 family radical SAM protein [Bacteroidota bacterium]|nr:PA0069 family radical SAM protein [Bacteroidota bacterium]